MSGIESVQNVGIGEVRERTLAMKKCYTPH
jgi:hypothetical protein